MPRAFRAAIAGSLIITSMSTLAAAQESQDQSSSAYSAPKSHCKQLAEFQNPQTIGQVDPSVAGLRGGAGPTASGEVVHGEVSQTIRNLRVLRDELSCQALHLGVVQTWFDASIIGVGIASVALAFAKTSPASIGGLAIGGGGLEQFRSYYDPQTRKNKYVTAIAAARCAATEADKLESIDPAMYWSAMQRLAYAIYNVEASRSKLAGSGASESTGKDAADTAISAAESAFSALQTEALALNDSPSTIDQAHDLIKNYRDKADLRTGQSIAAVQTALNDAISRAAKSEAATQTAAAGLTSAVKAQAKAAATADQHATAPGAPAKGAANPAALTADTRVPATEPLAPPPGAPISLADALSPPGPGGEDAKSTKAQQEADAAMRVREAAQTVVDKDTNASKDQKNADNKVLYNAAVTAVAKQSTADAAKVQANGQKEAQKVAGANADATPYSSLARQNADMVDRLNMETEAAQKLMPAKRVTTITAAITTCTAGL